jgi:hypothetical protein
MQVTVEIPDDMALQLASDGRDPARAALEAIAIDGYRSGALSSRQTMRLLGFEIRYQLDGFLSLTTYGNTPIVLKTWNRIERQCASSKPKALSPHDRRG